MLQIYTEVLKTYNSSELFGELFWPNLGIPVNSTTYVRLLSLSSTLSSFWFVNPSPFHHFPIPSSFVARSIHGRSSSPFLRSPWLLLLGLVPSQPGITIHHGPIMHSCALMRAAGVAEHPATVSSAMQALRHYHPCRRAQCAITWPRTAADQLSHLGPRQGPFPLHVQATAPMTTILDLF